MKTLNHRPLGFCESPQTLSQTLCIFAHRNNGTKLWFRLQNPDTDSTPEESPSIVEIKQPALIGYLQRISFDEETRDGEPSTKLHIYIQSYRPIKIESGYDSNFSKGFLLAIASLTLAQLQQPITIEAVPGTKKRTVLFCAVWLGKEKIKVDCKTVTDWKAVARHAMANVQAAQGVNG